MAMTVNTNVLAMSTQRTLNRSNSMLSTAIERLSSGLRINSAKDDAAGMAISNRFTSQINGTTVAIRNASDAISLAQTGEGALQEYTNILQRMRDLAVQSANDTNSDADRAAIQSEVEQLKDELGRIGTNTKFNGINLFDGSKQVFTFQTGANVGDTVDVKIQAVTTDSIGAASTAGVSSSYKSNGTDTTLGFSSGSTGNAMVSGDLVINGVSVGASSATNDTASVSFASSSAISKVAAVNEVSDLTGVRAVVNANTVEGTEVTAAAALTEGSVQINNTTIDVSMSGANLKLDLDSVAERINQKQGATGVTAEVVETDGGYRIDLTAADGRNIEITSVSAASAAAVGLATVAGSTTSAFAGTFTLISEDKSDIVLSTDTGEIDNAGLNAGTFSGSQAQVVGNALAATSSANAGSYALSSGDLTINDVVIGATNADDDTASTQNGAASSIAKAAAINKVSDQTGVTAVANANVVYGSITAAGTGGTATFTMNGVSISVAGVNGDKGTTQTNFINAINDAKDQTGVRAEIDGDNFTLIADDGRNIAFTAETDSSFIGTASFFQPDSDDANLALTTALGAGVYVGSVSLISGDTINLGTNTSNIADSGLRVGSFGSQESGQLVQDIDVSTVAGANKAITAIDNALTRIDDVRSDFGAIQNRFESTIANLQTLKENLTESRSTIVDTDFASETAELTKSQVLVQIGTAMLSQANATSQNVLALLG